MGVDEPNGATRARVEMAEHDIVALQSWQRDVIEKLAGMETGFEHLAGRVEDLVHILNHRSEEEERQRADRSNIHYETAIRAASHFLTGITGGIVGYLMSGHPLPH